MKTSSVWRMSLLTWVMFTVVDLISGGGLPMKRIGGHNVLVWMAAGNAIVALTLGFFASRAPWRGFKLAIALSAVPLAIQVINIVEGLTYLKIDRAMQLGLILSPLKYALLIPLWLVLFRQPAVSPSCAPSIPARPLWGRLWRFALCSFSYLILYLAAGILIYPLVRAFYATQPMPSMSQLVAMQLFLRGPAFVGICIMLSHMIGGQRASTAFTVGLVFALISGVAPLIIPNPLFPDSVRWVHFCEVTGANFIFGVLVVLIWSRKVISHPRPMPAIV